MSDRMLRSEEFCQKQPLLLEHLKAVLTYNQTKNLTSISDLAAGKVLHIEDSLAILPEVEKAPSGALADLGSGAGYPGIPLALATGRQTTLIEANKKKAAFLQGFVNDNDLADQVTVTELRSEELAQTHAGSFAVVTARAVAELPVLLELAAPLLSEGGHFVAMKGRPEESELLRGNQAAEKLCFSLVSKRSYSLGDQENKQQRCVLVYEKRGQSSFTLPRRPGMAAKRPLA